MTYEEYEEHKWQENEEIIVNGELCVFEEHDEVHGQIWVKNDKMPRAKSVSILGVEFKNKTKDAVSPKVEMLDIKIPKLIEPSE